MFLSFCYSSAWLTGVACLLHLTYNFVRKYTYVTVNCWFCNLNSKVQFEKKNEWYCSHCQQFNGFDKDGGYSKLIPEQYNEHLNFKYMTYTSNARISKANGLCRICNANQELKIKQLASYEPQEERNFEQEIDHFKQKLEKSYKLCSICEKTVRNTLKLKSSLFQSKIFSKTADNIKCKSFSRPKILANWKYSVVVIGLMLLSTTLSHYYFQHNIDEVTQMMESFFNVLNNFKHLNLHLDYDSIINIVLTISTTAFLKSYLRRAKFFGSLLFGIIIFVICDYLTFLLKITGIFVLFTCSTIKFLRTKKVNKKNFRKLSNKSNIRISQKEDDDKDNTDVSDNAVIKNPLCGKFSDLNLGFPQESFSNLKKPPYLFKSTKALIQPSRLKLEDSDNLDSPQSSPTISSGYESIASFLKKSSDSISEYDSISQVGNNCNEARRARSKWRYNSSIDNGVLPVTMWDRSNLITPYYRERPYLLNSNQYYGVSPTYSSTPSTSSQAHEIQMNSLCSSIQIILCSIAFFILGFSFQMFVNKIRF